MNGIHKVSAAMVAASLLVGCQLLSGNEATTYRGGSATITLEGPPMVEQTFGLDDGTYLPPGVSDLDGAHLHYRADDGTLLYVQWLGSKATTPTMFISDADRNLYGSWELGERDADCLGRVPADYSRPIQSVFDCASLVLSVDGRLVQGRGTVVLTADPTRDLQASG